MFLTKDKNNLGIHQSYLALIYLIVFFLFFLNFCLFQDRVSLFSSPAVTVLTMETNLVSDSQEIHLPLFPRYWD